MDKDYWQQCWQKGEIGFNQLQPNELLQRYWSTLNIPSKERVFVPLCGRSIDMLWLANQGYYVVGVELSFMACEAFFQINNIDVQVATKGDFSVFQSEKITLFAGDFFQLTPEILGRMSVVYDRAALIALPANLRERYVQHLITLLDANAEIFLITTSYEENEMKGPPFSVDEKAVESLYAAHFSIHQLCNKMINAIPAHLQAKGLTRAYEQAYCLLVTDG